MSKYSQKSIEARNRQFDKFLENIKFEVVETELTPEKKQERRAKADACDLEFAKIYYPQIFSAPFSELHRHIAALLQGHWSISGYPMSGKTAFATVAKIIKPIAKNLGGVYNYAMRKQPQAVERTSMIKRLIMSNPTLVYDYDIDLIQDKKGYYIFGNCILIGTSYMEGLRSYLDDNFERFRVCIMDDLYNRQSVTSEPDNESVYNFVTGEVQRQMEDDGLAIWLGNSITHDCPMMRYKKEFPERHFSFPCIDSQGNPTWHENPESTKEYWKQKEKETTIDLWQGEYLDLPYEMGEVFDQDMIHYFNINTIQILAVISVIDPAHGVSPSACFKAIMTGGWTSDDRLITLDQYVRKEDYFKVFDYVDKLRQTYKNWKAFLFENDFNQWNTARPYYEQWRRSRNKTLPIIQHNSRNLATDLYGADKESRILNLVYPHQMKEIQYSSSLEGDKDHKKYIQQLVAFGAKKEKLDAPDAMATLYIMAKRYVNTGTFKPSASRKMKKENMFSSIKGIFR